MFIGEYTYNLDNKGRLAIPAKFRDELSGGAIVTRGLDGCLWIFTKKEWGILAEKINRLPISQSHSRAFSRLMLSNAYETELDIQGRILIPENLRIYASLNKKIVIAGVYNRLEIWDEKIWHTYRARTEKESGDIAEKLGELGI